MSDSDQRTSRAQPQVFPRTRWSVVLAATQQPSPEAEAALETICRAYWYPLYAFVRRSGQSPHDAQDLTQEFFRHLLEKRWLEAADREKGRLRTFLVTALKHFMAKEWRRASAHKRGGGQTHVPITIRMMTGAGFGTGGQHAAYSLLFRSGTLRPRPPDPSAGTSRAGYGGARAGSG